MSLIGRSDKKGYRKHSFLDKPRMKGELKNKKQIEATLAKIKEQITKKQSMPKRKSNLSHTKRSANKKGSSRKSDLSESFKRNEKIFDSDDSGVKRDLIDTPNNIQSYTELSYSIDNAEKANRLKENISKQLHDYNKKSRKKDINAIEIDDDLNDLFVSSQNYRTNESPQRKIELEIDSEDSWELKYETIEPENQISLFKIVHNSSNNDSNKIPKNYKIFSCGVFVAYDPEKHKKRSYQQSNQFKLINLKNSEQKSSVLGKEFDYDFAYKGNSSSNEIVIKSQNNSLDQLADKNEPDRNVIIGSDSEEMSDSHLPEINEVTERGSSEFDKETRNGLGRVYSDLSGSGELQSIKIRNQHFINSKLGWKKNDSLRTDQNSKTGDLPGRDKLSSSNKNVGVDSSYTQSNTSGYYLTRNNITQQSERIVKMGVLEDRKDDIDKGLFNRLSLKPAQKKDNYSIEMGFDHENQISNNTKTDELIEIEEVEFERVGNLASEDELDSPIEISKKNKELNVNKCVSPMFRSSKNKLQKGGGVVRNSLEKSREEIIGIQKAHMVRLMENNISITSDSEFEEIRNPKRRTYDNLTEDNLPDELLEKKVINQKNLTARTGDWLKNIKKKKSKEANFKYNKLKPKLTKPTKPIRGSYLPGRLKTSYKSKQTRFPKISLTKGTPDKVSKNMMENAHNSYLIKNKTNDKKKYTVNSYRQQNTKQKDQKVKKKFVKKIMTGLKIKTQQTSRKPTVELKKEAKEPEPIKKKIKETNKYNPKYLKSKNQSFKFKDVIYMKDSSENNNIFNQNNQRDQYHFSNKYKKNKLQSFQSKGNNSCKTKNSQKRNTSCSMNSSRIMGLKDSHLRNHKKKSINSERLIKRNSILEGSKPIKPISTKLILRSARHMTTKTSLPSKKEIDHLKPRISKNRHSNTSSKKEHDSHYYFFTDIFKELAKIVFKQCDTQIFKNQFQNFIRTLVNKKTIEINENETDERSHSMIKFAIKNHDQFETHIIHFMSQYLSLTRPRVKAILEGIRSRV